MQLEFRLPSSMRRRKLKLKTIETRNSLPIQSQLPV